MPQRLPWLFYVDFVTELCYGMPNFSMTDFPTDRKYDSRTNLDVDAMSIKVLPDPTLGRKNLWEIDLLSMNV